MPGQIPFNETSLFNLQPPNSGYADYWDPKTTGLYIRIYAAKKDGSVRKVFYFRKYAGKDRKSHRLKLGEFPALTIPEARRLALEVSEKYDKGENVFEGVNTFSQLFQRYADQYAKIHQKTFERNTHYQYNRRLKPAWGERPLSEIRTRDIQVWVNEIGRSSPDTANRCLAVLRAVLQWGIVQGYVTSANPCLGVKGFKTQRRKRYLSISNGEFEKFKEVLDSYRDRTVRDFFWMCYYTGARKTNVLKMQWVELDLENGYWHIPLTKNGEAHTVALSESAIELLKARRLTIEEAVPWVFPASRTGPKGTPHLSDPKKGFRAKLKAAGVTDFRIHDIRHTTASHMVINNVSLEIVGEQLGHKSLASTRIYAHLAKDVLRTAINKSLQK